MKRVVKQTLGLSAFAAACMAIGMGLSHTWVATAQEEKPVVVDAKGLDRLPPISEVAEKLNPTVVSIRNTSFVKGRRNTPYGPFGDDDFFDFFFGPRRPTPRTPRNEEEDIQRFSAGGSGVVISSSGEILTNHHVIEGIRGGEAELEVKLSDGRTFKAKVLGSDKEIDIALIKIEANHLPFASLGDSDKAKVGEWVVAIGNPLGLDHTVTQGIISAKGRAGSIVGGGSGLESFLQTDAAINRGNSGGPLLNLRGEVIGINTAIRADGQNIGFAVPMEMVKRSLKDLRSGRPVSRGFLGVIPAPLDVSFQETLGVKKGVVVSECTTGQAADKAGVKRLDIITHVDDREILNPEELIAAVASRRAGEKVKLGIVRDGKTMQITVTLGDRKDIKDGNEDQDSKNEDKDKKNQKFDLEKSYGFEVSDLDAATRHQFGIAKERKGVVITRVNPRSEAAEMMGVGMLITAVGAHDVSNVQEFEREAKKMSGKPLIVLLEAPRGEQRWTRAVPLRN